MARRADPAEILLDIIKAAAIVIIGFIVIRALLQAL